MKKGLLVVLSGPSGVGKGTVRKQMFKTNPLNLVYSVSMTTRAPREREVDGVDYYFVSRDTFLKKIERGEFLEYAEFVGNFYGTPLDKIEEARNQGKNLFLEIEINGANQVFERIKDDGVVSFFLMPPNLKALEDRIRKRKSESEEIIHERLAKGEKEMKMTENYDYVILNDSVERAAKEITSILERKIRSLK